MAIDAASYSALNKIYKLLDGSLDVVDDIQIKSVSAAIDWQDINSGSEHMVVLSDLVSPRYSGSSIHILITSPETI